MTRRKPEDGTDSIYAEVAEMPTDLPKKMFACNSKVFLQTCVNSVIRQNRVSPNTLIYAPAANGLFGTGIMGEVPQMEQLYACFQPGLVSEEDRQRMLSLVKRMKLARTRTERNRAMNEIESLVFKYSLGATIAHGIRIPAGESVEQQEQTAICIMPGENFRHELEIRRRSGDKSDHKKKSRMSANEKKILKLASRAVLATGLAAYAITQIIMPMAAAAAPHINMMPTGENSGDTGHSLIAGDSGQQAQHGQLFAPATATRVPTRVAPTKTPPLVVNSDCPVLHNEGPTNYLDMYKPGVTFDYNGSRYKVISAVKTIVQIPAAQYNFFPGDTYCIVKPELEDAIRNYPKTPYDQLFLRAHFRGDFFVEVSKPLSVTNAPNGDTYVWVDGDEGLEQTKYQQLIFTFNSKTNAITAVIANPGGEIDTMAQSSNHPKQPSSLIVRNIVPTPTPGASPTPQSVVKASDGRIATVTPASPPTTTRGLNVAPGATPGASPQGTTTVVVENRSDINIPLLGTIGGLAVLVVGGLAAWLNRRVSQIEGDTAANTAHVNDTIKKIEGDRQRVEKAVLKVDRLEDQVDTQEKRNQAMADANKAMLTFVKDAADSASAANYSSADALQTMKQMATALQRAQLTEAERYRQMSALLAKVLTAFNNP